MDNGMAKWVQWATMGKVGERGGMSKWTIDLAARLSTGWTTGWRNGAHGQNGQMGKTGKMGGLGGMGGMGGMSRLVDLTAILPEMLPVLPARLLMRLQVRLSTRGGTYLQIECKTPITDSR